MTNPTHTDVAVKKKTDKSTRINDWKIIKEQISHDYLDNESTIRSMSVNIGDVFECFMGENIGDEQCKKRPVLVVSKTFFNNHSSQITIVPLSTTIKTRTIEKQGTTKTILKTKTHMLLKKHNFSFLNYDSVAKCEQIRTLSKARLTNKLGSIDTHTLQQVKKRLTNLLDL